MKILIATDGSEFSRAAIEKCCRMFGNSENIRIRIISAAEITTAVPAEPFMASAEYVGAMNQLARSQAQGFVSQAETQIRKCFPSVTDDLTVATEMGAPEQVIVAEATRWGADLVVTGSHGRGFWARAWLGSVSQAVMQHAPCSVLVVRKPKNESERSDENNCRNF